MRTTADAMAALRAGCDEGDFTDWMPVSHNYWDFEGLVCLLYLGHGVSVTSYEAGGFGSGVDSVSVAGRGFCLEFAPDTPIGCRDGGFTASNMWDISLSFHPTTEMLFSAPSCPGDITDPSGWDRGEALGLAVRVLGRGAAEGEPATFRLDAATTVSLTAPYSHECEDAVFRHSDDVLDVEFTGRIAATDRGIAMHNFHSYLELRLPADVVSEAVRVTGRRPPARGTGNDLRGEHGLWYGSELG